jgi:hypothetical protein
MIIEGGTGNGFKAKVDSENRLYTFAVTQGLPAHVSQTEGMSYIWTAADDWGADVNTLWLRNDNTVLDLIISKIIISPAAACQFEIGVGSGNAVTGTEVTGTNLNLTSGNVALATCRHTNTNCDTSAGLTILGTSWAGVGVNSVALDDSLVLGYLDEVAVGFITDVGESSVNIMGYYHD